MVTTIKSTLNSCLKSYLWYYCVEVIILSYFSNINIKIDDLKVKNDIENFFKFNSSIVTYRRVELLKYYFFFLLALITEYLLSYFFYKEFWQNSYQAILVTFLVIFLLTALIGPKIILNYLTKSITSNELLNFEYNNNTIFYRLYDRKFELMTDKRITIISSSKLDSAILVFFAFKEIGKLEYKLIMIPFDTFDTSLELTQFEEELKQFEENFYK